ncbi:MAG: hypothetical protein NVS1B11_04610 [Terriglobales bacterium]
MSATANNPGTGIANPQAHSLPQLSSLKVSQWDAGRSALQALLAFSSLHDQLRQHRAQEAKDGSKATAENWKLDQFALDEVLQLVAQRALAIAGADGVAIALAEGDAIVCRAAAGEITPDAGMRVDLKSGFSGVCLQSGQIVRCDDAETDSRVNAKACHALGARSMVAVPLSARQNVIGLIEAFSSEVSGFNDGDVRSLNLLAELILSALKPEEEDRLAEISRRIVSRDSKPSESGPVVVVSAETLSAEASHPETAQVQEKTEASVTKPENPTEVLAEAVPKGIPPNEIPSDNIPTAVAEIPSQLESEQEKRAITATEQRPGKSFPLRWVLLGLVLLAIVGGSAVWQKVYRHASDAAVTEHVAAVSGATAQAPAEAIPPPSSSSNASNENTPFAATDNRSSEDPSAQAVSSSEKSVSQPRVTGIRHWSSPESSTVAIDLQNQVQYEAHRLTGPERIYLDLRDTKLPHELDGKIIDVGDSLLARVRIAQPVRGVTRVVLETKADCTYSVSFEQNPNRLVVEIRKPAPGHPQTHTSLVVPSDSSADRSAPLAESQQALSIRSSVPAKILDPRPAAEAPRRTTVPNLRIVLDAGHGGWDLGTVGRKGLLEKDLVLDIVQRLGSLVHSRLRAEVIYTRQDDSYIALEKRAEIANVAAADLFISIHANYSDSASARGVETYYTNTYSSVRARTADADGADLKLQNIDWTHVDIRAKVQESHKFAASIQRSLYGALATTNPDIRNRGVKEAAYVVLTGTSMPAVLAEVSFVSSPADESKLQSSGYRQQIAEALYRGIAKYSEASRPTQMASSSAKTATH